MILLNTIEIFLRHNYLNFAQDLKMLSRVLKKTKKKMTEYINSRSYCNSYLSITICLGMCCYYIVLNNLNIALLKYKYVNYL